jgi:cysteine sulfinate desulfinase/cysteine desulfurase-like protein
MGIEPETAQGAVRFSLGRGNIPDQIDEAARKALKLIQQQKDHPPGNEEELDLLSLCD